MDKLSFIKRQNRSRIYVLITGILYILIILLPHICKGSFEDFTTWTEVDPNSDITVSSDEVSWTAFTAGIDQYVYYDFGDNHFNGNFEHLITIETPILDGKAIALWMMGDSVAQFGSAEAGNFIALYFYNSRIRIYEYYSGHYEDSYSHSAIPYYITIERDETIGTYGTLYAYIYDNSGRTNLVDTISVALHQKADYRYLFIANGHSSLSGPEGEYVKDLDIDESSSETTTITEDEINMALLYGFGGIVFIGTLTLFKKKK